MRYVKTALVAIGLLAILYQVVFVIILLCGSANAQAAFISNPRVFADTSRPADTEYKLNRTGFLNKYGKDDSSRALIASYFMKRTKARNMILISVLTSLIIGIVAGAMTSFSSLTANYVTQFFAIALLSATVVLSIIGTIRMLIFSRKKLLRRLNNYFSGQSLPRRIRTSSYFKKQLSKP